MALLSLKGGAELLFREWTSKPPVAEKNEKGKAKIDCRGQTSVMAGATKH
jgi:hypothetical protein